MKKYGQLIVFTLLAFILTACGGQATINVGTGDEDVEGTMTSENHRYRIGEMILKEGSNTYYYGGRVYDSVVINCIYLKESTASMSYPIFIDTNMDEPMVQFPDSQYSIRIKELDRKTGIAEIEILKYP